MYDGSAALVHPWKCWNMGDERALLRYERICFNRRKKRNWFFGSFVGSDDFCRYTIAVVSIVYTLNSVKLGTLYCNKNIRRETCNATRLVVVYQLLKDHTLLLCAFNTLIIISTTFILYDGYGKHCLIYSQISLIKRVTCSVFLVLLKTILFVKTRNVNPPDIQHISHLVYDKFREPGFKLET